MDKQQPIAWMQTWQNQDGELKKTVNIEQIGKQDIPLYTHPVKELTLTDEQINILDNKVKYSELSLDWHEYMRRFARLVLKEAYYGEI